MSRILYAQMKERFPEDFMFQLTEDEVDFVVSQNAIPSRKHLETKWSAFSRFETGTVEMLKNLEGLINDECLMMSDELKNNSAFSIHNSESAAGALEGLGYGE